MKLEKGKIVSPFFWIMIFITIAGCFFLYNINKFINKGIDIVGGSYIVLNVQMDNIYQDLLIEIKKKIDSEGNNYILKIKEDTIEISSLKNINEQDINNYLKNNKIDIAYKKINENTVILYFSETVKEKMTDTAITSNIKTLRKRLDPFGAGEMLIARQGNSIILEIPNIFDKEHIRKLIGSTANLQMKIVLDQATSKEQLQKQYHALLDRVMIIPGKNKNQVIWYVVNKNSLLNGSLLKSAHVSYNNIGGNEPIVAIEFNSVGAKKFKQITENNINKQLAIVIDNEVITAPSISVIIPDGVASIQGSFTVKEAQELVTLLESGSFAAPVIYSQERVIAPLLGNSTIEAGIISCLIGMFLLFIFSIILYKTSGLIAFIILIYNLLITLFCMAVIKATLTLSGIAGLILTLGMAIDSSVLIFEKIREELKLGHNFLHAIEIAFKDGITVILDANITHFLVAIVLFYIGIGPLKGFAISMIIGIFATLITGIILLKRMLLYIVKNTKTKKISI